MHLLSSFKLALRGLLINKARSLLALLGIIIGIAAVITITALAEGLRAEATKQVDQLGTNLIFIFPQASHNEMRTQSARMGFVEPALFTRNEIGAIQAALRVPVNLSASVQSEFNVSKGRESVYVTVSGVDENYESIYNFDAESGRYFTPGEITGGRRVAILGYQTAIDLFGDEDPIGQTINIANSRFEVIGVHKERGSGLGDNPDQQVYVPLKVAQQHLMGLGDKVLFLTIQANTLGDVETIKEDITRAIDRVRRIHDPDDENYRIMSQTDALEQFGQFINVLTMVLGGVAAVSLLVGGIGIMNIMLVNVTERTREIGLRKAIGARQIDILFQFLIEAIVLCLMGGIIGMALGYGGAMGLSALISNALPDASWKPAISASSVIIAVVFSTLIGVIFGVYPAANAARQDPIAALRYE
jgi:putative ABC transport system permease protein